MILIELFVPRGTLDADRSQDAHTHARTLPTAENPYHRGRGGPYSGPP